MNQGGIITPLTSTQPVFEGAQAHQFPIPSVLALNKSQALSYQKQKAQKVMTLLTDL